MCRCRPVCRLVWQAHDEYFITGRPIAERPVLAAPRWRNDGLAIEDALGDATLFEEHVPLGGAVLEAAYAATAPPVARRLRSEHVPLILDMHSLRFTGEGFLAVERIAKLPYAPDAPLDPAEITEASARALAAGTAFFAQEALAATYTVPGLPLNDKPLEACLGQPPAHGGGVCPQRSRRD